MVYGRDFLMWHLEVPKAVMTVLFWSYSYVNDLPYAAET